LPKTFCLCGKRRYDPARNQETNLPRIALSSLEGACLNVDHIKGSKYPILAIHGFTGNISTWDNLVQAIDTEYGMIRIDVLGHGSSDSPAEPRLHDIEHTLRALSEILDRLSVQKVHWLGYSMGGRIALAAAVALPQRTCSLICESASPGLRTPEERAARVRSDNELAGRIEKEGIASFVCYWESLPLWNSQARLPPETRERLRLQRLPNNPRGLANSLRGIGTGIQPALYEKLRDIGAPALFVAGEEDLKYSALAQEMHSDIIGSRLEIIPDSGHAVHLEQPQAFNQVVLDFLRTQTADSRVKEKR
jgi:2-succinyl-6-hydroxy-2,4-cyclohexadiene-1-carboxylate synthase